MKTTIPELSTLSIPEKILFLEDLWDSISSQESDIPVPDSHVKELERRQKRYIQSPGSLLSLEEFQRKINSKK